MPEYISGRPFQVQILIENMLEASGAIRLMHDGGKTGALRYTREYRVYVKGKRTNATVRFIYNKREDWADITITYYNLMELKFAQLIEGIHNERIQVSEPEGNKQVRAGDEKARGRYGSPESQWLYDRLKKGKGKPEQT